MLVGLFKELVAIDGERDLLAVERLLQDVEIHPHLHKVLDSITPQWSVPADVYENFSGAVEKLGVQRFEGMGSAFFWLRSSPKKHLMEAAVRQEQGKDGESPCEGGGGG